MLIDPVLSVRCPFAGWIIGDEVFQDTLCAHRVVEFEVTVCEEDMGCIDFIDFGIILDGFFEAIDDAHVRFLFKIILGDIDFVFCEPHSDFFKLFFCDGDFFVIREFPDEIAERGCGLMGRFSVALPGIGEEEVICRHELVIAICRFISSVGHFGMRGIGTHEILIAHGCRRIVAGISIGIGDAEIGERRPARGIGIGELQDVEGFDGVFAASGFQGLYGKTVVTLSLALRLPSKDRFLRRTAAAHQQNHPYKDYFCYT